MEGETTYTVGEAAALLQETPERVLEMLSSGDLEGIPPGATVSGEWKVLLPTSLKEDPVPEAPLEESAESLLEDYEEPPATEEDAEQPPEAPQSAPADGAEPPTAEPPIAEPTTAEPTTTEKLSRGDGVAADPEPTAPSGWVSTQQAAKALGISPRTVRWHIEQGNLEAKLEGEGVKRSWLVSIDSLQAFRDARQTAGEMPRPNRATTEGPEIAAEPPGEAIRVLAERLEDAAARAAEYRVRLELTEQAESTLRSELEEERRRREVAERERDDLRRRLEAFREAREATQSAAETLKGPQPPATSPGPQVSPQRPPQPGRRRGALWRRVFGR